MLVLHLNPGIVRTSMTMTGDAWRCASPGNIPEDLDCIHIVAEGDRSLAEGLGRSLHRTCDPKNFSLSAVVL